MPHPVSTPVKSTVILAMLLLAGGARTEAQTGPPPFAHDLAEGATPWTGEAFDVQDGKFTFAIFSDLWGGGRPGVFSVAVEQLNLLRPELIMSIGDLIDGGTEDRAQLAREWDSFEGRAAGATAPVFHVGGNHDLTNLTMREVWTERFGARYYHFVYKDVLFLILDSEDFEDERMQEVYHARAAAIEVMDGPEPERAQEMEYFRMPERVTGEVRAEQSEYFQQVIAQYPDVRWTFLFMHKPVWLRLDQTEFTKIETALADRPYTVFNGHFHTYSRAERHGRDYITLATTGGGQGADDAMAFDHVTLVTMDGEGPTIANLRMDGILDLTGHIPMGGDTLCFQASRCGND